MDKIMLNQMQFYGYHGVFPEEKKLGQRYVVDVQLHTPLQTAGESDNMNDSIDYGHAYDVVKEIVEGKAHNLIETVAETIATHFFQTFQLLNACTITVVKPDPPISGQYESVSIEIYRERKK